MKTIQHATYGGKLRTREMKQYHKDRKEKHKNDLLQDPKENFKRLLASLIKYKKLCMFYKHASIKYEKKDINRMKWKFNRML